MSNLVSPAVGNTIIQQMGGFGKLRAMIGADNFGYTANSIKFNFKMFRKADTVVITLDPSDTYTMKMGKLNRKTWEYEVFYDESYIYCDMLKPVFEQVTGLRLSL